MATDPLAFAPPIRNLLEAGDAGRRSMPLVPSGPWQCPQLEALRRMTTEDLFGEEVISSLDDARCVHAGLYLYFSALDDSHRISQKIGTASGSYWHGVMHRQEGDWSNAKYWFRRTGSHAVFDQLERETGTPWDAFRFVDRCAEAHEARTGADDLLRLQALEWRLLMRHCYRNALGR